MFEGKTSQNAKTRILLSCIVIAAVLLACALPVAKDLWRAETVFDFRHFYRAAQAMSHGEDIYGATKGYYLYPPFLAFVFQPLTVFPKHTAAILWLCLSAVLVLAAAFIASKEAVNRWPRTDNQQEYSTAWIIAATAILLSADKIHRVFNLGQTDALMLLGFACVLRWMESKPALAGAVVGAIANIKYVSLIFVPYFLIKRNYRAAIVSVVAFVFFLALPAVQIGFDRAVQYATVSFGGLSKLMGIVPAGQNLTIFPVHWKRSVSITSTIFRFTRSHGLSDVVAIGIVLLIFVGVIAAIILICRRHGGSLFRSRIRTLSVAKASAGLEWAILIILALAFSPQTTARHMVLMLLVYTGAIALLLVLKEKGAKIFLIAAIALMVVGLSFPPSWMGLKETLWVWRGVGGASWCAIILALVLAWTGSRVISAELSKVPRSET